MQKKLLTILLVAAALAFSAASQAQPFVGGGTDYEIVAASQTNQVCGPVGGAGDILNRVIITVATAATAQTQIKDGSNTAHTILPNSPGGGIGVYVVEINARSSSGAWQITTGAGATAICVGRFK